MKYLLEAITAQERLALISRLIIVRGAIFDSTPLGADNPEYKAITEEIEALKALKPKDMVAT